MKAIVLFKSRAGHTKRYAEMISERLGAPCLPIQQFDFNSVGNYDLIVFGGNLYAVGIDGYSIFRKHLKKLTDKRVIIFAVGASPEKTGIEEELKNNNFESDFEKKFPLFYLRGGFDFSKLPIKEKIIMYLMKLHLQRKKNKSEDDINFLKAYEEPLDTVSADHLQGLFSFLDECAST